MILVLVSKGIKPIGLACSHIEARAPRNWPVKHIAATTLTIEHLRLFFQNNILLTVWPSCIWQWVGTRCESDAGGVKIARWRGCRVVYAKCGQIAKTILALPTHGNKMAKVNWVYTGNTSMKMQKFVVHCNSLSYVLQSIELWLDSGPPWSCFCLHMVHIASWDEHVWWQSTHGNTFASDVNPNTHCP